MDTTKIEGLSLVIEPLSTSLKALCRKRSQILCKIRPVSDST